MLEVQNMSSSNSSLALPCPLTSLATLAPFFSLKLLLLSIFFPSFLPSFILFRFLALLTTPPSLYSRAPGMAWRSHLPLLPTWTLSVWATLPPLPLRNLPLPTTHPPPSSKPSERNWCASPRNRRQYPATTAETCPLQLHQAKTALHCTVLPMEVAFLERTMTVRHVASAAAWWQRALGQEE